MRRYLPLALISLFLVVLVFIGTALLAGTAGNQTADHLKKVAIYTSLPVEQLSELALEYEKLSGIRVNLISGSPSGILDKIKAASGTALAADLVLDNREVLLDAKKQKLLQAYTSETTDVIPARFCDDNSFWVGVWYDPIVLAVNKDWLNQAPRKPAEWSDLAGLGDYRLAITDFLAADASANLLYTLAAVNGEADTMAYLGRLHPKVLQYAKLLVTPPRMAAIGEADIAIAVQSETLRYVKDGFPLTLIHPADGTAYMLTGVALVDGAPHETEAKRFIEWLLQDSAQEVLQKNKFYFIPTNPDIKAYKEFNAQAVPLFEHDSLLTAEQKAKLLDKWVQTVRLSPR